MRLIAMKKEEVKEHLTAHLRSNDLLIHFFLAMKKPEVKWYDYLIPSSSLFSAFEHRANYIGVSKQGIYIHETNFGGEFSNFYFLSYPEIASVKIKRGYLQRKIIFTTIHGITIKLHAQNKGISRIPKITPEIATYLQQRVTNSR